MQEIFSNYWFGLLILGPIAGVFWGWILDGRRQAGRSIKEQAITNQKAVVNGNKNTVIQHQNSNNHTVVHHHHGANSGSGTDPLGSALAFGGITIFVCAALGWGFAKHGHQITHSLFYMAIWISLAVLGFVVYILSRRNLNGREALSVFALLLVAGLNLCTAWILRDNFRLELVNLANAHTSILDFFFSLSTYGKTLILSQAIASICLVLSVIALIWRSIALNSVNGSITPDLLALIPIFGFLPLWLSNPNWSVSLIIRTLS